MSGRGRKARIESRTAIFVAISLLMIILPPQIFSGKTSPSSPLSAVQIQSLTPSSGVYFDHVVIILMENEGVYDICRISPPPCNGTLSNATFLAGLANNYTITSQYLSLVTTSQPNYVALISGSMQGCTSSGCPSPIKTPNLVDRFESAGLTWKGYFENMTGTTPGSCNADLNDGEPYTPIHNPFVVFQDVTNNTSRCNKLVNANPNTCGANIDCTLVNDLNNATSPAPNFMWLTPNDCNDMRGWSGCGTTKLIQPGDTYLSKLVPKILTSKTFTTTRSALFITFDEGNKFCPGPFPPNEDCVYASWSGPVAKTKFGSGNLYSHYSFTKTIETNWNLTSLTLNDADSNSMAEFFKNQPADYNLYANPEAQTSNIGTSTNTNITLTSFNNFTGTVSLSATSSPTGPTLTLNPASVTLTKQGTATSKLSFQASTIGNYTITLRAISGSLSHTNTITIQVVPPDFTISSSPSSLTIGQTSIAAGSTVPVNATGDRTFFESSYLRSSFQAQGLIWLFYEDSRFQCEHMNGCLTYTSSTNGSRWANPTRTTIHITDNDFSVYTNGTSIFYIRYNETSSDSSCGRKMQFGLGTLNTSGIVAWQPEQTVFTGAANRAYPEDEILVDSNGQVWIGYLMDNKSACNGGVSGQQRPQVMHSVGTNFASWTGNTTLCTLSCSSRIYHVDLASLGNGQVYGLYWISRSGTGIHGRIYNGTTWRSEETVTNDGVDVNAWLFNNNTNLNTIYFDNNTETFDYATRSSTGTWTISTIGIGETHTGTTDFTSSYYALPDTASYDPNDNLFTLFYLNGTNQKIDQWIGTGNTWTKNTGIVNTPVAPYPNSIYSFIQFTPAFIGQLYYITGSTTFTINSIRLSVIPAGNTGSLTITINPKFGFTGTITLNETITPSTGLAINCNPTMILGGSGTSTCGLTSMLQGSYNVTVTGTSGALNHNTIIPVRVMASPDFTIVASTPHPADVGTTTTSTITVTGINGFTGTVLLADTTPGLSCTRILPSSLTTPGTASLSCMSSIAGDYTATVNGSSNALNHTATVTFHIIDFSMTASSLSLISPAGTNATATLSLASINQYRGNVTIAGTISVLIVVPPSGGGGTGAGGGGTRAMSMAPPSTYPTILIVPSTMLLNGQGQSTLTIILPSYVIIANYTVTVTATDGTLTRTQFITLSVTGFAITSPVSNLTISQGGNSTQTLSLLDQNGFQGNVTLSANSNPSGLQLSLNPTSVLLASKDNTTLLTIVVPLLTIPGNYTVTVTAVSGALTRTAMINVLVPIPGHTLTLTRIIGSNSPAMALILGILTVTLFTSVRQVVTSKKPRTRTGRARSRPIIYLKGNPNNQPFLTIILSLGGMPLHIETD